MKEVWSEGDKSTSFFFAVHDSFDGIRKLYLAHSQSSKETVPFFYASMLVNVTASTKH